MSVRHSFFAEVLDKGGAVLGLFTYLTKKWAVPKVP